MNELYMIKHGAFAQSDLYSGSIYTPKHLVFMSNTEFNVPGLHSINAH